MDFVKKMISKSRMKRFAPYVFIELDKKKKEFQKRGKKIISLAIGDPDIPTPSQIAKIASREVRKSVNHSYPSGRGTVKLRRAIARWHHRRFGVNLDEEKEILVLIGSKEGIAHLPFTLLNRGDTAIIPDPSYPAYKTGVILSDGKIHKIPLLEKNGFLPDIKSIGGKVLGKTSIFFINYPNNPTGAFASRKFLREIVEAAKKHHFLIAQDAAYSELYFSKPAPSILEINGARDVAVEFHSLSKTFCMTGWRLAWLIGNRRVIQSLAALKENIDSGQFNAIQETAVYALNHCERFARSIRKIYKGRRDFFSEQLQKYGWKIFASQGTFFLWARPPIKINSLKCALKLLKEAGVLAAPGRGFGKNGEGYIRFSLTAPMPLLRQAAKSISRIKW